MLQRLPSLGRLGRETDDRQFTDTYILDGLRAKDVGEIAVSSHETVRDVLHTPWGNGLDSLGQRILANDPSCSDTRLLTLGLEASRSGNKTLASDVLASLTVRNAEPIDFGGMELAEGHFVLLDLSKRDLANIPFKDCTFGNVVFGSRDLKNVRIINSLAEKVTGATSAKGLPAWAQLSCDNFESVVNTASIRRIGLKPAQQILATTIRKTFLQKGSGRKEEALTRGFARIGNPGLISKVLNLMITQGLLETTKGSEGTLYIPVRKHTGRMKTILDELATSRDPLWVAVSAM